MIKKQVHNPNTQTRYQYTALPTHNPYLNDPCTLLWPRIPGVPTWEALMSLLVWKEYLKLPSPLSWRSSDSVSARYSGFWGAVRATATAQAKMICGKLFIHSVLYVRAWQQEVSEGLEAHVHISTFMYKNGHVIQYSPDDRSKLFVSSLLVLTGTIFCNTKHNKYVMRLSLNLNPILSS